MEATTFNAILDSLQEVSDTYLKAPIAQPDPASLEQWQPAPSAWQKLQAASSWIPGIHEERMEIDGHRIHYWRIGSGHGTPVVLLHGFGASKETWASLIPAILQRHMTLYLPDLPGFGQSDYRADARYTYEVQAHRMGEWARHLALPPAYWVGSSMGGAIGATLAANHPERVAGLVLMNAAGMGSARHSPMESQLLQGRNPLIPGDASETRSLFRYTTWRGQAVFSRVMPLAMGPEMRHRRPINQHLFMDMMQPRERIPELLARVQAPARVIWGERDQVVDVSCAHHYGALLPRAQVTILRGVGHLPMLEAPLRTARVVRRFMREHG
ncbi:alpha/beta fold hydrolase [Halomonadaceae bacterium KBTZ08]